MRRLRLPAAFLLTIALSPGCSESKSPDAFDGDSPKRVIWVAVDSMRADHLGAWGYERETSPWMDDLAGTSVTFSWAVSPANGTLKSVAGYFSGKPFSQLGDGIENRVPDDVQTLAESLASAGFRCSAFTTNIVISPARGYAQGFDDYRVIATPARAYSTMEEMIAEVREHYRPTGGREFIYLHTMDVHSPYRPPHPYGAMFAPPYSRDVVVEGNAYTADRMNLANSVHPFWSDWHDVTQEDIDFLVGLYDGAIRYTDARLPALLDELGWDPAHDVLILSADHGEALYEHGWWGHFGTLAPTEIHVPLIVNYAGFDTARVDAPVGLMDLYPTILDLFGLPHPEGLKGRSLLPALNGGAIEPHGVYSETAVTQGASAAMVDGDYWYYLSGNRTWAAPWHPWPYEEYLYRYAADPQGRENLIDSESDAAARLNARLREFNPRWSAYTREAMRGDDAHAPLGSNLLAPVEAPNRTEEAAAVENGTWTVNAPVTSLAYTAAGLTPWQPLYLEMPFTLESGRLSIKAWPAEFRWPGKARTSDVWEHHFARPGEYAGFGVVIVPTGESLTLIVSAEPGTRATVSEPALRRIEIQRIEPWPHPPRDESALDAVPEEIQRMKALGYL